MTTTVNDIEHIESQSYNGVAVIKVYFHEGAKVEAGVAQVTSICQTLLRTMPPGTTPPLIIQFSASNVPILQLGLSSSKTLSEQAALRSRAEFHPHPARHRAGRAGAAALRRQGAPGHGRSRSRRSSSPKASRPSDVSTALNAQNVILPGGHAEDRRPRIQRAPQQQPGAARGAQRSPDQAGERRDGLHARRGPCARRLRRADRISSRKTGTRSALLTVLKSANASTLDIIQRVKEALPAHQGDPAAGAGDHAALRSIDLRPRLDQWRAARKA